MAGHTDDRSLGQFFFELGYGACWADAFMADQKLPQYFPLSDAVVDRAWDVLPMCQDTPEDCAGFDSRKALADAAPTMLEALQAIEALGSDGEHSGDRHARCRGIARQAIAAATGEAK